MNKQLPKHSLASKVNKSLPKLKCILGQPFPRYCPKFSQDDIQQFKKLIIEDMKVRNLDKSKYVKETGIRIGLKSCLRAINSNSNYSCVLLSAEIKPAFIVQQIIHMVAAKAEKNHSSVFYVTSFGQIIEELFGIQSLALTLPNDISPCITKWLQQQFLAFPIPIGLQQYHGKSAEQVDIEMEKVCNKYQTEEIDFNKIYVVKTGSERSFIPQIVHKSGDIEISKDKKEQKNDWTGDFIPFSKNELVEEMDVYESKDDSGSMPKKDAIFGKYHGTKVHKIRGNPNKRKNKKK